MIEAALKAPGWRALLLLQDVIYGLVREQPVKAGSIYARMHDSQRKRQIGRRLEAEGLREFTPHDEQFWLSYANKNKTRDWFRPGG